MLFGKLVSNTIDVIINDRLYVCLLWRNGGLVSVGHAGELVVEAVNRSPISGCKRLSDFRQNDELQRSKSLINGRLGENGCRG